MLVVREDRRVLEPQLVRAQQQLREIHHARALALRFVLRVELDQLPARRVVAVLQRRRAMAFILIVIDEVLDLARHPARLVELHGLHDLLDEPKLIFAIENLEGLRQPRVAPVQAQQPVRDAVERAHPHAASRNAQQLLDAPAHFVRGLVRERHREDGVRRGALRLDDPGDAVREHARLAGARAGEHQHRAHGRGDRRALRVVQRVENRGEVIHGGANYTGWAAQFEGT